MSEPEARTAPAGVVKVTVNLPVKVWKALTDIAEEEHISKTEALRRAISTEVFRRLVEKEGASLVVEKDDGTRERVRFPY